jgi:hypothetical protein
MASGHGTDRLSACRDLGYYPGLVFITPCPPSPGAGEHFQPTDRLGDSTMFSIHSKPNGPRQTADSQIRTSSGRWAQNTAYGTSTNSKEAEGETILRILCSRTFSHSPDPKQKCRCPELAGRLYSITTRLEAQDANARSIRGSGSCCRRIDCSLDLGDLRSGESALADFPKGPPYVNGADEASRRRLGRTNGLEPRRRKLKRPQALSLCGRRAQN